jgi:hypothetical protein
VGVEHIWIPALDLELTGPSWRGGLDETSGFSQPKMEVNNHQNVVLINREYCYCNGYYPFQFSENREKL